MDTKKLGWGTRAVHAGRQKNSEGCLTVPIYQTSTFIFDSCAQGGRRFEGQEEGYIYTRLENPTQYELEKRVADLEGAEQAFATSSGMGAISAVLWTICSAGSHIISDGVLYGCSYALLSKDMPRYGVEVDFVDTADLEQIKAALKPNTKVIYLETPANPNLKITDIEAVCKLAHEYNPEIKVVCDNTFATPLLQNPLALGADVVVHSATKYLNGHGDVIAGFIVGSHEFVEEARLVGIKNMTGSVIGPQEAYYMIRGLKTLEVRMARHCENARKVAAYLDKHPKVEKVYFPGLESHPGHEIAKKQMRDFGGMVSFEVKGGKEAAARLLDNMEICSLAVSLGTVESLIEHPATMTHSTYSAEELKEVNLSESLIRFSCGIENAEDIIADFEQAFEKV